MAYSKIIQNGETLIDLTNTTATANDVAIGKTFLGANGEERTGTGVNPVWITQDESGYIILNNEANGEVYGHSTLSSYDLSLAYPIERQLLCSWDLTKSLTDTVSGRVITLGGNATRDSNGLKLTSASDYATLPVWHRGYFTYEFDIASMDFQNGTTHGRLIMSNSTNGLIYRSGATWGSYYNNGWNNNSSETDDAYFAGKTLAMKVGYDTWNTAPAFYVDGSLWYKTTRNHDHFNSSNQMMLGSSAGQSFFDVTITAIRVYWGGDYSE